MNLLVKLAKGEKITNKDIENELFEVCDREHSGCSNACPVFELMSKKEQDELDNCPCFKDGKLMRKFIVTRTKNSNKK